MKHVMEENQRKIRKQTKLIILLKKQQSTTQNIKGNGKALYTSA